ncbi:hypothetical protein BH23CHL5_BH23CHL5_07510 [soil metagenome]
MSDTARLRTSITDQAELAQLRAEITRSLPQIERYRIPAGERGDNLILALVALRLKFSQEEAQLKLEKNLQLRRGGRPAHDALDC